MNKKIIFSSGGTGGHIFPAINLMKYLSEKEYETILVTDKRGSKFLEKHSKFRSYIIDSDTPTNKNFIKKVLSIFAIFFSIIKSSLILKKEKPNLIIGFGGYVSFPISFSSRFYNIPLVIYENNSIIGKANKKLLPYCKKILIGTKIPENFPINYKSKVYKVGVILRKEIINYSYVKKNNNSKILSILVLGGSQGAEVFGKIVSRTITMLKDCGYEIEINQQCVKNQKKELVDFYNKNNIKNNIFTFSDNILKLISLTDFAISRCGASTTAELAHTLTPFIAVPFPNSVDNHQFHNAKYYEEKGYCWVLEQYKFNSTNLFNLINEVISDKKKLENIRQNMKKNDSKNVYRKIENAIKEFI